MNENNNSENFSIFPNPSNGIFNLIIKTEKIEDADVYIYNSIGQTVFSKNLKLLRSNSIEKFDLSNFTKGLYHLTISNEKEISNFNLILE